jgi:hypothetical protein
VAAANVYFDLTRAFNARGPAVALASGQAVVYYRVAIMSKDGDWVVREDPAACARVLEVLADRGAWYRPGAPLDARWLSGGWSSHFEYRDERERRVRCDFSSRPPRVDHAALDRRIAAARDPLAAIDLESLIRMKQTQRDKDYAVIGALAARLPPAIELQWTMDVDRVLALAPAHGAGMTRPAVAAAVRGDRDGVVIGLARERDRLQRADRIRVEAYASAAREFLAAFGALSPAARALPQAHGEVCRLAERWLPTRVTWPEAGDADAQ